MKLLKFSRSFWETAVAYGGSDKTVLRDYDILRDLESGKTWSQIQIKYDVSRDTVSRITNKYKK